MSTLSIIIPAYNEEKNIEAAVKAAVDAVDENGDRISDYEILLFDDGSKDRTGKIVDSLAINNNHITVTHNNLNKGFGYNVLRGIELAKMDYTVLVPGDNEWFEESIGNLFARVGDADIISSYPINTEVRHPIRRFLSKSYTNILNFLFGLRLRYYNDPNIIKTDLLKKNLPSTFSFAYAAEIMVKLLKWQKASYIEVGMKTRPSSALTTALRFKNIISVFKAIFNLFFAIYFNKPKAS